jgi:CRP-like cAMP-binding protein
MPMGGLTAHHMPNRLLSTLPFEWQQATLDHMQTVALAQGQIIYQPGDPVNCIYFPTTAVVSLLNVMGCGASIEVALVGNEGMLGGRLAPGVAHTALARTVAQIPGEALMIKTIKFQEEMERKPALNAMVSRYNNALLGQIFQAAGCNGLHSTEQRCARWLLATHDRVGSDEFPLTQELLAEMLGVRRQSISGIASALQQAGTVRYSRGQLKIVNRRALESISCECYRRVREECESLLKA